MRRYEIFDLVRRFLIATHPTVSPIDIATIKLVDRTLGNKTMSTPTDTQTKIELTLSQTDKEILEKAAAAKSMSIGEYLVEIALNAAKQPPLEVEKIVLSDRDWEIFSSAIENPPEPNPALKAAIKEHQEKYGNW